MQGFWLKYCRMCTVPMSPSTRHMGGFAHFQAQLVLWLDFGIVGQSILGSRRNLHKMIESMDSSSVVLGLGPHPAGVLYDCETFVCCSVAAWSVFEYVETSWASSLNVRIVLLHFGRWK